MGTRFHQKKISRLLFGFYAVVIFALLPEPARAATEIAGASLEVEAAIGAESCPSAEALSEQTSKLGSPRATAIPGGPLRVQVKFLVHGSGYRAIVRTSGRTEGTRELSADGPSCAPLSAATAVFLAVLLDLLPASEVPKRGQPAAEWVEPVPPREHPAPQASARAPNLLRYAGVGAHLILGYGLLGPALSESIGGEARLRLGYAELEFGGFAGLARQVDYPPGTVSLRLAAGHLGVCGYLGPPAAGPELGACAKLLLGQLLASGSGFDEDRQVSSFWFAGAIAATFAVPLSRHWAVRFGLDVVVPFRQYTVEVEQSGVVFNSSPLAVTLAFGPEFRFR